MAKQLLLGADPEFFVSRRAAPETALPICGLLGGTKAAPVPIPGLPEGYFMQEDGLAAEFNIPPVSDEDAFVNAVTSATSQVLAHLNRNLPPPSRYAVHASPSAVFDVSGLSPAALQLGCDPDLDAYAAGSKNPPVTRTQLMDVRRPGAEQRMCGFHLHIGYVDWLDYSLPPFVVAQLMDIVLGLRTVASGPSQGLRRQLYGRPGCFRVKPYGIEYRMLDNRHLLHSNWLYEYAAASLGLLRAMKSMGPTKLHAFWADVPWDMVRHTIAQENPTMAEALSRQLADQFTRAGRRTGGGE